MATPASSRAAQLVELLGLAPHPEGGWYRELFRSSERVTRPDGAPRDALTTIYFLLAAGTHSRWHRVEADEVWHHYEGASLELLSIDPGLETLRVIPLGSVDGRDARPVHTVPAGWWQAARTTGEYTLVGCTVGPGFDFADFALLDDRPDDARVLRERFAEVRELG
jgi:predicted cupin superfamily sugar epimerase